MTPICLHNGTVLTGFAAMERCAVLIEDGMVADVFSQKRFEQRHFDSNVKIIDVNEAYIAPGFIDTHIHGFGGYGTEDTPGGAMAATNTDAAVAAAAGAIIDGTAGADSVIEMSRLLAAYGVSAFNPTLYPSEPGEMLEAVARISSAMGREEGARIMGLHLEGPFLSLDRLGVQRPETVRSVDIPFMERLWEAAGGHIVNMTVAPELKGMRELALFCIKKGIILQAGHTNANYENMVEGMQAGILHSTHLFNAMSKLDHRNPNAVGTILTHPEMSCEIIADGFHVHPDLFKLLLRDKPIDKIVLITDGLKPTEQKQGPFFANKEEVVFRDGVFRRKSDDIIAGSGLTMIRGVKNLVSFGFSPEDAVKAASTNPAQIMRYRRKGTIIPGNDADITVFDKNFTVLATLVEGVLKHTIL
jgi:N-acetylglucosamine-6-phosphate deacetylase